jgi:hypothetical protein
VPLFKQGSRCSPLNYRLVSLTSVCCKVMERIVVSHIVQFLEYVGLLSSGSLVSAEATLQKTNCCLLMGMW